MTARALSSEARHALIVEALSDAIVARVRRRLEEQALAATTTPPSPEAAANDTSPAPAVASRR